jgi:hypothetical protein
MKSKHNFYTSINIVVIIQRYMERMFQKEIHKSHVFIQGPKICDKVQLNVGPIQALLLKYAT